MSISGDGYLLDSHVLLWWWFDPDRLSEAARLPLLHPTTTIRVIAATVLELSLKHHQGKLPELDNVIKDLPFLLQGRWISAVAHLHRPRPESRWLQSAPSRSV